VVNALVGAVGLEATLRAISAGADIALANKEVLVMAGDLVMKEVRSRGTSLIPVDSEHSAVFQCLAGEDPKSIRRVILTASGGPLRDRPLSTLDRVTVEEALLHPNWSMGRKVTIDSATLMNKGLEIIEACRLFDLDPGQVDVVIHPSSIVHSMVEFIDGSIKAHLGVPDMRIPIAYALGHPNRLEGEWPKMDFTKSVGLEFLPPDPARFPALGLALDAIRAGGTAPAVLNAADETAVELFLAGHIGFVQIVRIVEEALKRHALVQNPGLEDIFKADQDAREFVNRMYHRS
jgi:1-deoxy-D-xylulose-5-phosphate reductoisomerase